MQNFRFTLLSTRKKANSRALNPQLEISVLIQGFYTRNPSGIDVLHSSTTPKALKIDFLEFLSQNVLVP